MLRSIKNILNPLQNLEKLMIEVWPMEELRRMDRAFERHGFEPIHTGERNWLKRINDLIEHIEKTR